MNGRVIYWGVLTALNVILSVVFAFKGDNHVFVSWLLIGFCWYMMESANGKNTEDKNG